MADFFWFSDEQWARIEPLLPTGTRGMKRVDDRRVLLGIVHALQSGGRGGERGIWGNIFSALAGAEDVPDRLFVDSACIKVHRTAGGAKGEPWPMVSARHAAAVTSKP
jgi:hypothetical protein